MIENQNFGQAIEALKEGKRVARHGWNGKGMFLFFQKEKQGLYDEKTYTMLSYIIMKTADDKLVPWLASQTDMLAEDWLILN